MKKTVLFLSLTFSILAYSCFPEACEEVDPYFDIIGTNVYNYKKINENSIRRMEEGDEVDFDSHSFSLEYTIGAITHQIERINPSGYSLYARQPCDPFGYLGSQEQLDTIIINTNFPFDDNHPQGSTINDLIGVGRGSLDEYLISKKEMDIESRSIYFKLDRKPTLSNNFSFQIYLRLTNGESYTSTSKVITFK